MNDTQEHASSYPPFQPVPMPENAAEGHFLLVLVIIMWAVGLVLVVRMGKNK